MGLSETFVLSYNLSNLNLKSKLQLKFYECIKTDWTFEEKKFLFSEIEKNLKLSIFAPFISGEQVKPCHVWSPQAPDSKGGGPSRKCPTQHRKWRWAIQRDRGWRLEGDEADPDGGGPLARTEGQGGLHLFLERLHFQRPQRLHPHWANSQRTHWVGKFYIR